MNTAAGVRDPEALQLRAGTSVLQVLGGSAYGGGTEMIHAITRSLLDAGYFVTLVASDAKTQHKFSELGTDFSRHKLNK